MKRGLSKQSGQRPTPSKIPVLLKKNPAVVGTADSHPGETNVKAQVGKDPQTELEKLDFLRSKLEQSADEFIKARKEFEEMLSAEGSNEQLFLSESSSAELKTELQRNRELTSKVESSLKGFHQDPKSDHQGSVKRGSSYEFLKSIMG